MKKYIYTDLIDVLSCKGTILYPTDTVWGIGCNATDTEAVSKIFNIKQRNESKSLVILVDGLEMLKHYVEEIPEKAIKILKNKIKPTTIIYNNPLGLAKNVVASDNTIAIRIVQDEFCQELIRQFGKPIVSTSANVSGKSTPKSFKEIDASILNAVDYVVNLHQGIIANTPSRIIKFDEDGLVKVIRD